MTNKRDDFTKSTIDILAKRVGYHCSNPKCRKYTVGPNDNPEKATLIGVAAHITAASSRGPRYNSNLSEEERKHINNGIWLCSNCATLIDKDETYFPTELILDWKESAEQEIRNFLLGDPRIIHSEKNIPFIEADLIWNHGGRYNRGFSQKNIEKFGGNLIPAGSYPIIYWLLEWNFTFVLHNNSKFPAFNLKVVHIKGTNFTELSQLPKINNLPPYSSIDLKTKFQDFIEGTALEAREQLRNDIPEKLNGTELKITYFDENRKEHISMIKIQNGEIVTN